MTYTDGNLVAGALAWGAQVIKGMNPPGAQVSPDNAYASLPYLVDAIEKSPNFKLIQFALNAAIRTLPEKKQEEIYEAAVELRQALFNDPAAQPIAQPQQANADPEASPAKSDSPADAFVFIYEALKTMATEWVSQYEVDMLEKNPQSSARRVIVGELIDQLPSDKREKMQPLAQALFAALGLSFGMKAPVASGSGAKVAGNAEIDGVPIRIHRLHVGGNLTIGPITVG